MSQTERSTSTLDTDHSNAALNPPPRWVLALLLVVGIVLAYQPVWHARFIWDDDVYITENKLLTAPDGLRRIWFSKDSPSQYFPLVYTAFRLERAIWGVRPAGYHWVNILLHAGNALLLWQLLQRLRVPGAWLGAALFALHPVQVESVAWVTERKNVLSLIFFLLALLSWTEFLEERPKRRWLFYGLSLAAYLLALFSKTTACTLPAALLLILWLKAKPINRRHCAQVAPFVALGLGMGLLTIWWERYHIGTSGGVFAIGLLDRILIASHAVWFYLGKLLWPANLAFSYPRWVINPADPVAYVWPFAGVVLAVLIYSGRRFFGRSLETAALFYVAMLSPLLGFLMLFTFRYTFVADHYQYIACIGPLALAAAAITITLRPRARTASVPGEAKSTELPPATPPTHPLAHSPTHPGSAHLQTVVCGLLLLTLATLTWRQARAYQNNESLWRDTIAKNPDSWLAHSNLGRSLMRKGQFDEAIAQYHETLRINPNDVDSLVSVGNALFGKGRYDEAISYYNRALQVNPQNPEAHVNLAVILVRRGRIDEAIEHDRKALEVNPKHLTGHVNLAVTLARAGRFEESLEHYRLALEISPDQPLTHINLAIALSALGRTNEAALHYANAAAAVNKHADALAQQGRLQEAEAQFLQAIRMIPNNAEAHCQLATLLARQNKRADAQAHFNEALRLRPGYAEALEGLRALASGAQAPGK